MYFNTTYIQNNARNNNLISLTNKIIAKRDDIYANQVIISNATLYSEKHILIDTINNGIIVRTNSDVSKYQTARHMSTITLLKEGVSKSNQIFSKNN